MTITKQTLELETTTRHLKIIDLTLFKELHIRFMYPSHCVLTLLLMMLKIYQENLFSYAPWCPACKSMTKTWNEFGEWSKDLDIGSVKLLVQKFTTRCQSLIASHSIVIFFSETNICKALH